jgi:type I restriction enzyme, S subunit
VTLRVHPDEIVRDSESRLLAIHPSWERTRLADVADVLNGFAFKSTSFSKSEGVPLLRIRDVGSSGTETNYVGDFDPQYLVEPESIVVGMDGDFRVARWTGPVALLNQRVCKISVRDEDLYDAGFLFYALPGYLDAINALTSSVTVKHLSSRTVQDIPLPLPPVAEQRRIVAAIEEQFSRLDAAKMSLRRPRRNLARLRVSAVSEAMTGVWPTVRLGDVTESQIYGSSAKATEDPGGVPILRMGNIRDGTLDFTALKYLPGGHPDVEKCRLLPGDLLFNRTNSPELVGKSAVFKTGPDPTVFASYLIRVRLSTECSPDWVALVINSPRGRQYIATVRTQQVGQANVNGTKLAAMPIPLPPIEEQDRILGEVERQLSIADSMASEIQRSLRRSGALRRAILEQAFSGELVPQDPLGEPASALLERIAAERAVAPKPARRKRIRA